MSCCKVEVLALLKWQEGSDHFQNGGFEIREVTLNRVQRPTDNYINQANCHLTVQMVIFTRAVFYFNFHHALTLPSQGKSTINISALVLC